MKFSKLFLAGLLIVFTLSCEKEQETTINDFVGSWKATSVVITDDADPENEVDLIALGGEMRFTMLEGGKLRTWITLDSFSDEWDSQAEITGSKELSLTPAESSRDASVLEFEFKDSELILINRDYSFDFTLSDSTEVQATSVMTFVPN